MGVDAQKLMNSRLTGESGPMYDGFMLQLTACMSAEGSGASTHLYPDRRPHASTLTLTDRGASPALHNVNGVLHELCEGPFVQKWLLNVGFGDVLHHVDACQVQQLVRTGFAVSRSVNLPACTQCRPMNVVRILI